MKKNVFFHPTTRHQHYAARQAPAAEIYFYSLQHTHIQSQTLTDPTSFIILYVCCCGVLWFRETYPPLPHRTGSIFAINSHYLFVHTFVFISECTCLDIESSHTDSELIFNTEGKQTFLQRNHFYFFLNKKCPQIFWWIFFSDRIEQNWMSVKWFFFLWFPKNEWGVRNWMWLFFLCNVLVPNTDRFRVKKKIFSISMNFVKLTSITCEKLMICVFFFCRCRWR